MLQSILFLIVAGISGWFAFKGFSRVRRNIMLGKAEATEGSTAQRWKHVLLVAFGQQKMFKNWLPAVLHFFIYAAFVITQVELIEIFVDGIFGTHRFHVPLWSRYVFFPHNCWYHFEHHLWAYVSYQYLPAARQLEDQTQVSSMKEVFDLFAQSTTARPVA